MRMVPVDVAVLVGAIGLRFGLGSLTARQVHRTDTLLDLLGMRRDVAESDRVATATKTAYFEWIDRTPDEEVLASGTDERFWSNESFLMLASFDDKRDRFEGRALLAEGRAAPDEFIQTYYAEVRKRIFDLDVLLLGCTTSQLLIATHYGVVLLLEPKKGREQQP